MVERVAAQRGLAASDTEARIASQLSNAERRKHAQLVIHNDGSLADLKQRVDQAWERLSQ